MRIFLSFFWYDRCMHLLTLSLQHFWWSHYLYLYSYYRVFYSMHLHLSSPVDRGVEVTSKWHGVRSHLCPDMKHHLAMSILNLSCYIMHTRTRGTTRMTWLLHESHKMFDLTRSRGPCSYHVWAPLWLFKLTWLLQAHDPISHNKPAIFLLTCLHAAMLTGMAERGLAKVRRTG